MEVHDVQAVCRYRVGPRGHRGGRNRSGPRGPPGAVPDSPARGELYPAGRNPPTGAEEARPRRRDRRGAGAGARPCSPPAPRPPVGRREARPAARRRRPRCLRPGPRLDRRGAAGAPHRALPSPRRPLRHRLGPRPQAASAGGRRQLGPLDPRSRAAGPSDDVRPAPPRRAARGRRGGGGGGGRRGDAAGRRPSRRHRLGAGDAGGRARRPRGSAVDRGGAAAPDPDQRRRPRHDARGPGQQPAL